MSDLDKKAKMLEEIFGGKFTVRIVFSDAPLLLICCQDVPRLLEVGHRGDITIWTQHNALDVRPKEIIADIEGDITHTVKMNTAEQYAAEQIVGNKLEFLSIITPSEKLKKLQALKWKI